MHDILFEPFSEPYFQDVLAIDALCFPKYPYPPEAIRNWINLCSVYILRTKSTNTCIGYIVLGKPGVVLGKRLTSPYKFSRNIGYIYSLAIDPNHQRRGYGLLMLQKACAAYQEAERIESIEVHTRVENPARFLYEKAGFKRVRRCPEFYPIDEGDAYEFVLHQQYKE